MGSLAYNMKCLEVVVVIWCYINRSDAFTPEKEWTPTHGLPKPLATIVAVV